MKFFRFISGILLANLILVSSTSFMIGVHRCGGHVMNIALFDKAPGCEMSQNLPICHLHMKVACCEDQTIIHKGESLKISLSQVHFHAPTSLSVVHPPVFISEVFPDNLLAQLKYSHYDPPPRSADLIINYQVFLI